MPKYNVMINRTRTIEESVELEISAKDESAAQEKAENKIAKAMEKGNVDDALNWEETATNDEYEYEASEA